VFNKVWSVNEKTTAYSIKKQYAFDILTYLLTYILTYLFTYLLTYIHAYLLIYLLTYIHTYLLTCLLTYLFTYLLIYIHTYLLTYILTYILTYLLTPKSRVLQEKLTGSAASQEIPLIFGTRRFLTVFTSARHLSLS